MFTITYCPNVDTLRSTITTLHSEGRYLRYLKQHEDGSIYIVGAPSKVSVSSVEGRTDSICTMDLPLHDIERQSVEEGQEEHEPFIEAAGLQCLAYGFNRGGEECPYFKVQQDPEALALYELCRPSIEVLDEEDNPTGETAFRKGTDIARG